MPYFNSAKKAAIRAKVRTDNRSDILDLVDEIQAAIDAKAAENVAELDLTVSGTYDSEEVQSIADKVDAIIAALVAAGLMEAGS